MAAAHNSINSINRRRGSRIPLDAPVYFSDAGGFGALSHGRIVERSSGGITLESVAPVHPGTVLDIEVQTATDDQPVAVSILKGRVKHLNGDAESGYRIGVELEYKRSKPRATTRPVSQAPVHLDFAESTVIEETPVKAGAAERSTSDTYTHVKAALLVVLVLVCASIFFLNRQDQARIDAAITGEESFHVFEGENPVLPETLASVGTPRPGSQMLATEFAEKEILQPIDRYATRPQVREEEERLARFVEPPDSEPFTESTPAEASTLSDALDLGRRSFAANDAGNLTAARALSAEAQRLAGALPEPWAEILGDLRGAILAGDARRGSFPSFDNWVGLGPQLSSVPVDAPVVVYVDTTNFTLTVVRDGDAVLQFPVGLGVQGSTPQGVFAIGNKIVEPTWYNGGNPVSAGDQENPLGDRWMGLSDGGDPLVYGIHPTDVPASIGDTLSRGCIRMRPSDARTLYAMIPLGTPVVIGPGAAVAKL